MFVRKSHFQSLSRVFLCLLGVFNNYLLLINSRSRKSNKAAKQVLISNFQKSELLPKVTHNSTRVVLKYNIFRNTALIRMIHRYGIQVLCTICQYY
ncbi:hypothetical protein GDO78_019268 [Eleutherodactylus coqui]|uniref:Uncharacterized protein n=1 Tax=Eleutherodactylus coqui TaxID=57060 RepID=A0A8J6B805_ELECQ|nr:hypothetical protein GDO78_019268 [Eleutherodactylus coqui]